MQYDYHSDLSDLNEEQREAVLHREGPCMVLAGAGSGKTRVLTRRVAHLIETGVRQDAVLAITFTNKAAQEMRERVNRQIPNYSGRWIQTFHAASNRILRMNIQELGYDRNFTILDDGEARALVKEIIVEEQEYERKPEELLWLFKQAKNSLQEPEDYFQTVRVSPHQQERLAELMRRYNARLKSFNALDFEDLIVLCVRLFREFPEVLKRYQGWFQYIMVDEYQDTNYAQYVWARLLAAGHHNIFAVGDPDQSIYSWRGAEPYNVKRFLQDYPEARLIKLLTNYRSSQNIIAAANAVIRHNEDRESKELRTVNDEGEQLQIFTAANSWQEADYVADQILKLFKDGEADFNDCAVFYRTHAQSRAFEEAMMRRAIAYRLIGARKFYERREVRDVLAYLRLLDNPRDVLALRRVINIPRRGVGDKSLERIESFAAEQGISPLEALARADEIAGLKKSMVQSLQDFQAMLLYLTDLARDGASLRDIIDELLEMSGYVEELERIDPLTFQVRLENIHELRSLAVEFEKDGGAGLEEFLTQVALVQDTDTEDQSDAVTLMTFHGAKGLEFPVVFMTGMEEGVFPSFRAETPEEMEEERRICYVGITRAQRRIYFTHAHSRFMYGYERSNPPSRFLQELPAQHVAAPEADSYQRVAELTEGDRVRHKKFGEGYVIDTMEGGAIAVVDFRTAGIRTLRVDIAPLQLLND
ncbi:MAG: UvrD-helicase domain-containing protein [Syntrophomonadaceae bacterium]|nr:UvrD-helicase domain-containing protein [Syntrophomonadaceae bacterium]